MKDRRLILTFLVVVCSFILADCQNETIEPWDKLSRLIPSNSVYEHQDKADRRSSDENDVVHEENRHQDDGEEDGAYEDEYETERTLQEDSRLARLEKSASSSSSVNGDTEDASRDEDYLEDPSTSHYDAYYYYDDYESNNRSRYQALAEADPPDYPDSEEEAREELATAEAASKSEHESSPDEHKDPDSSTSNEDPEDKDPEVQDPEDKHPEDTNPDDKYPEEKNPKDKDPEDTDPDDKDPEDLDPTRNLEEQGSSMEGSDKTYRFLGPDDSDTSILIGEAVVSVVTTKSVVNGTISVPTTSSPTTTEQVIAAPSTQATTVQPPPSVTTEDTSRILASVQTSRSISGARFLPFPVIDRVEPIDKAEPSLERKTSPAQESTESIIDKLDRVQSELSSGILVGGFRTGGGSNTLHLDVLGDRNSRRRFTTTGRTPVISKFVPRRYNDKRLEHGSTTARTRLETTLDNLEGLLPNDYVTKTGTASTPTKIGFRWPSSTKTTTTTTEPTETKSSLPAVNPTRKTKANTVVQDISAFLPPGYKLKKEDSSVTESSLLTDILAKSKVDISSLLPPNYNKNRTNEESSTTTRTVESSTGGTTAAKSIQDLFAASKVDISALLPKDYKEKARTEDTTAKMATQASSTEEPVQETTTKKAGGLKIVFPSRPGGRKPIHKITTPTAPRADAPGAVTPKIQKGWPTRATTEFTGWPTPSTTPISIEKLLEAARTATIASMNASLIPITSEISSTTTTTTTTTTPRPTTPGTCEEECEVAGTIRIIGNATWVPELLDRNTKEWQHLANEIENEMNFIFSKSALLAGWYKKVRIDSFSQGSILVDYFVELTNLQRKVNTQEVKTIFHDSLRTYNTNRWSETGTKDSMKLGSFTIDPKYTDFIVIPRANVPQNIENEDRLVPQWAITVIVVGVGGLLFIIIFGVSVLVNRQHGTKLKPTVSTIYDEEISKSHRSSDLSKPVHTIWTDPDVSWNDKSFESTSNKVLVEKPFQDNKKYNLHDSWRSEWNGYYYNPSHTTSSKYGGYDSTTNLSGRHHPDYDTNF